MKWNKLMVATLMLGAFALPNVAKADDDIPGPVLQVGDTHPVYQCEPFLQDPTNYYFSFRNTITRVGAQMAHDLNQEWQNLSLRASMNGKTYHLTASRLQRNFMITPDGLYFDRTQITETVPTPIPVNGNLLIDACSFVDPLIGPALAAEVERDLGDYGPRPNIHILP